MFEGGGMVPKGDQRSQEVEEEVGINGIYLFPDRVWYSVEAWCACGEGLGESSRDLLFGEWDG